jgi:hypothetical protein
MTSPEGTHGSCGEVFVAARSTDPLPLPDALTNDEQLELESAILAYVREIALVVTERVHRVARETGLDVAKLQRDTESDDRV